MPRPNDETILKYIRLYRELLLETQALFVSSGEIVQGSHGWLGESDSESPPGGADMPEQMYEMHRGFVMKVFATIVGTRKADSLPQRQLGRVLLEHLWEEPVVGNKLHDAVDWLLGAANDFAWAELLGPFLKFPSIRDRWGEVETLTVRQAKLIAAVDGDDSAHDNAAVSALVETIGAVAAMDVENVTATRQLAKPDSTTVSKTETLDHQADINMARDAIAWLRSEAKRLRSGDAGPRPPAERIGLERGPNHEMSKQADVADARLTTQPAEETPPRIPQQAASDPHQTPEERLATARAKLDRLIGLDAIKNQIQTLANFLKMEQHRREAGLPTTRPSLHMAFVGNPGTGKTTVARIIAEIFGALGVLTKGHLVETDRSGLVAEYAGQTGPKTNAKIDEALDGVLFIDEAYTLVDESGQDQYGREAVQTLLKRMEDQRDRLVVILAGYPKEMSTMIRSNPGLSSRVGTTMQFDDYDAEALCRIFELIAGKAKYVLPGPTRRRLLRGFTHLFINRDRHFGNGRTARNGFERSVRRLANRLATAPEITEELLVTLQPGDIELPGITDEVMATLTAPAGLIRATCPSCDQALVVDDTLLGTEQPCDHCQTSVPLPWGTPVVDLQAPSNTGVSEAYASEPDTMGQHS
ncbi:MAG: AAA family ATPase [Planctomycetota bacterium]